VKALLELGTALVPWVTLVGLVVHCLADKKRFVRKDGK
jgi:hypothetical protein